MKPEEVISVLETEYGQMHRSSFTFGERAEEVPGYGEMLEEIGYSSHA